MKTIKNYFVSLFLVIAMPFSSAIAQDNYSSAESSNSGTASVAPSMKDVSLDGALHNHALKYLNLTYTVPASLQSQMVRMDYENQSIFSLKTGGESSEFLFSVNKVTGEQWMKIKNQVSGYKIIENKDGFIIFVQKTDAKEIKGSANLQYKQALRDVDTIIASLQAE